MAGPLRVLAVVAVTGLPLPSVIPPVSLEDRADQPRRDPPAPASAARGPLPLVKLLERRVGTAVYGISVVASNGRVADHVVMQALGWAPGRHLNIRQGRGLVFVIADDHGLFRVTARGHVLLPVAARRSCGLAVGDRVLLAAYPRGGLLVVHAPGVLDAVVDQVQAAALAVGVDD